MTEINVIDAEVVAPLDIAAAKRLDSRIRLLASATADSMTKLFELVAEAKIGQIHIALGFKSWTAYLADALAKLQMVLTVDSRRELVGMLADEGMSNRAIAQAVGVTEITIRRDREQVRQHVAPEPPADVVLTPFVDAAHAEAAAVIEASRELASVIGLDGKTYRKPAPAPKPRKPRRRPITEAFRTAKCDLTRIVGRVTRLSEDERFIRNADGLHHMVSDLVRARIAIDAVIAKLDPDQFLRISDYMDAEASKKVAAAFEAVAE